jgi:hypothetical protein
VKVTFVSSWPAKANVNSGGRESLAKNKRHWASNCNNVPSPSSWLD